MDQAPRLRLPKDIDFSKAKHHNRCHGTGISGYRKIDNPEKPGESLKVPVVCRCVTRAGGVRRDAFDKMSEELQRQISDGTYAQNLAMDIRRLPTEAMIMQIQSLKRTAADKKTDPVVCVQIEKALQILDQEA